MDAGAAKFSVGFGLIIFAVLQIAVFFIVLGTELMMEEEENLYLPAGRLSTCTRSRVCVSASRVCVSAYFECVLARTFPI